jgi:hypothetical protein
MFVLTPARRTLQATITSVPRNPTTSDAQQISASTHPALVDPTPSPFLPRPGRRDGQQRPREPPAHPSQVSPGSANAGLDPPGQRVAHIATCGADDVGGLNAVVMVGPEALLSSGAGTRTRRRGPVRRPALRSREVSWPKP